MHRFLLICMAFFCWHGSHSAQNIQDGIDSLLSKSWDLRNSRPDSGILHAQQAIDLILERGDAYRLAEAYNFKGLGFRTRVEYDSSLYYFDLALQTASDQQDSVQIAYSYNNLGGIYRLRSSYFQAIRSILTARQIFHTLHDEAGVAYCDINLAVLYRYQEEYDQAAQYLQSAIQFRKKNDDTRSLATAYSLLAENFFMQKEYDSALVYYRSARDIYYTKSGPFEKAANNNGLGGVYLELGLTDSAQVLRQNALELAKSAGDPDQVIRSLIGLAEVHDRLKQPVQANAYIDSALIMAQRRNLETRILEALKTRSAILANQGQFREAYEALQAYQQTHDTIFSEIKSLQLQELNSLHQSELQKNELARQKHQLDNQRKKNRSVVLLLIVVMLILIQLLVISRSQRRLLRLTREEKKVVEDQKQVLDQLNSAKDQFFTMIAHDLRSPFQSLLGLSDILATQVNELDTRQVATLAKKVNQSAETAFSLQESLLNWARSQLGKVEVQPETFSLEDMIRNTVRLFEDTILQKQIQLDVQVGEPGRIYTDRNILSTALRNLINNAVKFTPDNGIISIRAERRDEIWILSVADTGIGISADYLDQIMSGKLRPGQADPSPEKGSGLGLLISQNFIRLLGGKINAESTPGSGSTFSIHLPDRL